MEVPAARLTVPAARLVSCPPYMLRLPVKANTPLFTKIPFQFTLPTLPPSNCTVLLMLPPVQLNAPLVVTCNGWLPCSVPPLIVADGVVNGPLPFKFSVPLVMTRGVVMAQVPVTLAVALPIAKLPAPEITQPEFKL